MKEKAAVAAGMVFLAVLLSGSGGRGEVYAMQAETARESASGEERQEEAGRVQEEILEEMDFAGVDKELKKLFPREKVSFSDMLRTLLSGNLQEAKKTCGQMVKDRFFYELSVNRKTLVQIFAIALTAAVITNFSGLVKNRQISEIGFYMLYLLLITVCLQSFQVTAKSVTGTIEGLGGFMKVLGPVYFLAVALTAGTGTSLVFYQMLLILLYVVESVVIQLLVPMIHVYMMMRVLDNLSPEACLTRFAQFLDYIIRFLLKMLVTGVIGVNVLQGLLMPMLDAVKRGTLAKGIGMIPGLGDVVSGTGEILLASVALIKNGIGMAGAVAVVMICLTPAIQTGVFVLLYKLAAALIQPVSDKRIVDVVAGMGDGMELLMKTVFASGLLFLLTIAIVAATT